MIIFHEGLPRSGKSYEAMAVRIIPAIAAGRVVVAYVEGINHDQIADLAGVTPERCRELLHAITREQVQTIHVDANSGKVLRVEDHLPQLARDNALVVVDEAQNFWGNRAKLGADMVQFITEHGHRGIDLVLMGQDLRDVHAVWRRRVEVKLAFLKLNGLTVPPWAARFLGKLAKPSYSVTTYRHLGGDQFTRAGMSVTVYDPKYFGTYKSFVADDTNTEVYTDKRAQVWSHPLMRYVIPGMLVAALWGAWKTWGYFHPAQPAAPASRAAAAPSPASSRPASFSAGPAAATPAAPDLRPPIERRMSELAVKGRIRLAGLISSSKHTSGIVEWVEGGTVVVERLSLDVLRSLGVAVIVTEDSVVQLAVGNYRELATPWPLQDMARVSDARQDAIRGPHPVVAAAPLPQDLPRGIDPPSFVDRPGTLKSDEDAGSMQRRISRVAR